VAEGGVEIITFSNPTPTKGKTMAVKLEGWHTVGLCKNKCRRQLGSLSKGERA